MKSGAAKLGLVFANDHQNVIPLFQRPYVWKQEANWAPLWEDIRQAAKEVESEQASTHEHERRTYFLGAIVRQDRPKQPQQVSRSNIVDGQQRLTTLQVLIAASREVATDLGANALASSFGAMLLNRAEVINPSYPDDRYKVWPLPQDRPAFFWAVAPTATQGPVPDDSHELVAARRWFQGAIRDWALLAENAELRLYHLLETLKERMQLVEITLEAQDDPQVIFEVLNHRGVPLDAVDLVKNLLFQQPEHAGKAREAEHLLTTTWSPIDRAPWRDDITVGRLRRKRADVLLSYWLVIHSGHEVPVEHLFADFRSWLLEKPRDATEVITSIRAHADTMEAVRALPLNDPTGQLLDRMEASQTTTPWPVLLQLHCDEDVPEVQRHRAAQAIDSFLMRRTICRMPQGDYTNLFLAVLKMVQTTESSVAGETVECMLLEQTADSRRWPTDEEFSAALLATNLFHAVVRARLKSLLMGLEFAQQDGRVDPVTLLSARDKRVNIEHLLPQAWEKHWPLGCPQDDPAYAQALERRQRAIHQLGNLTVVTTKLNPSVGNRAWTIKRRELAKNAHMQLTTASVLTAPSGAGDVTDEEWASRWDEDRIERRGNWLANLAVATWSRPVH